MKVKKILLACDHAGYNMKNFFFTKLISEDFDVCDFGNNILDLSDDYPDYLHKAAEVFSCNTSGSFILVFGGSGVGESILINRYSNIRCLPVFVDNIEVLETAILHDNINGLAFGCLFVDNNSAYSIFKSIISTEYVTENKYIRRILKIDNK